MHGPERIFDVEVAFDDTGIIRSMKMRALDNVGAYAGRSPFQLGKPVGAIVGPYQINSVQYHAIAVVTNKTAQEAVRGFGQSPTNLRARAHHRRGRQRARPRSARGAPAQPDPARGISLSDPERHDLRQRRLSHRDRQGAGAIQLRSPDAERDRLRARRHARRHRHRRLPRAVRRQFLVRAAAQPEDHHHHLDGFLPHRVDGMGTITATMHTTSAGQGHETLVGTVVGEVLELDPDLVRVMRPDSLNSLPSNRPVGSRMAIMLGGAAFHAAQKLKDKLIAIARARSRHCARTRGVRARQRVRPQRAAEQAQLGRSRADRAPQYPPHADGYGARAGGEPHLCRCRPAAPADAGRPRADVSLLLVRIPSDPAQHRSRSRQAADQALSARARLRHGDQPEDRARHDHGRHRARHRRRAATRSSPTTTTAS